MFMELFRFFYDFLSATLLVRRNYYDNFVRKAEDVSGFFEKLKKDKTVLHGHNQELTTTILAMKSKIERTKKLVKDKEGTIKRREKEIRDSLIETDKCDAELKEVIDEKDHKIYEILSVIEKIPYDEYSYVLRSDAFSEEELEVNACVLVHRFFSCVSSSLQWVLCFRWMKKSSLM